MDRTQLHSLLPHQGQALWLDALLGHDAGRIEGLSAWHHLHALGHDASPWDAILLCVGADPRSGNDLDRLEAVVRERLEAAARALRG